MATLPAVDERFDMGRVVSRAFGVILRNIVLFFGLTLTLSTLPSLILRVLMGTPGSTDLGTTYIFAIASILVAGISGYVLTAALCYATVSDMNGERPTFGKAFSVGVRFAIPLLLLAIVSILGFYIGLFLLVVPGIIVGLMWCVAAPAMVTENLGVFASLGRSRALTKGWRWQIFGLLLVAFIVVFVPLMITPLLTGALTDPTAAARAGFGIADIVQALLSTVASMILIALLAAIYVELRAVKEGASTESLASIFA